MRHTLKFPFTVILFLSLYACRDNKELSLKTYRYKQDAQATKIVDMLKLDKSIFNSNSLFANSLTRMLKKADRSQLFTVLVQADFLHESPRWQWYLTKDEKLKNLDSSQVMIIANKLYANKPSPKITALYAVLSALAAEMARGGNTVQVLLEEFEKCKTDPGWRLVFQEKYIRKSDCDTVFNFIREIGLLKENNTAAQNVMDSISIYTVLELVKKLEQDKSKYKEIIRVSLKSHHFISYYSGSEKCEPIPNDFFQLFKPQIAHFQNGTKNHPHELGDIHYQIYHSYPGFTGLFCLGFNKV